MPLGRCDTVDSHRCSCHAILQRHSQVLLRGYALLHAARPQAAAARPQGGELLAGVAMHCSHGLVHSGVLPCGSTPVAQEGEVLKGKVPCVAWSHVQGVSEGSSMAPADRQHH